MKTAGQMPDLPLHLQGLRLIQQLGISRLRPKWKFNKALHDYSVKPGPKLTNILHNCLVTAKRQRANQPAPPPAVITAWDKLASRLNGSSIPAPPPTTCLEQKAESTPTNPALA
jgi:hypothetical protein